MKAMTVSKLGSVLAGILVAALPASALTITLPGLPGYERSATLSSATDGVFGSGNTQTSDLDAAWPTVAPWTNPIGEATSGSPTGSGLLSITVDVGGWGQPPVSGTWTLDSAYWTMYDYAAISMHVGNGNGEPDHFIWLIEYGQLSGTWSYDSNTGGGGGLSNLQLRGAGDGSNFIPTPDGGSTMLLLGAGLVGFFTVRRRATA